MRSMKILCINATEVGKTDFALPFETDEQVLAAWNDVVSHRLLNLSYRHETEGTDATRSLIEQYLKVFAADGTVVEPFPDTVRRFFTKIYQAELNHDIRELIGV